VATRADRIEIIRQGRRLRVLVDGAEFPCSIVYAEPVRVDVHPDTIPTVQLVLTAGTVTVTDTLHDQGDDESEPPR
jgi:hypothetical protein